MNPRDYFPLGKAYGKAFCNRKQETAWLVDNILACKHSLLIAPRRFGKSSLAEKAIKLSALPITGINFNTCTDERDVEHHIHRAIGKLIGSAIGPVDQVLNSIKRYVNHLTPNIQIGPAYARLELTASKHVASAASVEEALLLMEKLLAEKNKQAVMLFDEFQTVGLIAKGHGVEAAIRNAAQEMKHLVIIYSGSNRRLLRSMFEDESRPLYKLCRKLALKRIDKVHYRQQLNRAAKLAWQGSLPEKVFEEIMRCSERHPHYVNYLCDVIWTRCARLPKISQVNQAWQSVIEEELSDANVEIARMPFTQRKVLKYIANMVGKHLKSAQAIRSIGLALSSISSALTALLEKDIIEKRNGEYIIINPVIKAVLNENAVVS